MARRARLLAAGTVALVALGGSPAALAANTVTVEGTVVTITVPIDIQLVGADPITESDRFRFRAIEGLAERFWNRAFRRLPYGDCFTLNLDVQINLLPDGPQADPTPGNHQIEWFQDENFHSVTYDQGTPDATHDAPTVYNDWVQGQWGDDLTVVSGGVAHEVGHLLGLGDDYRNRADGTSEPLPGREGTLMDGGSIMDQTLIDRIGKMIEEAGIRLPECWKGTITEDFAPGGGRIVAEGPVQLAVDAEGAVTGRGSITFIRCAPNCHGVVGHTDSLTFSGTRTDRGFRLTTTGPGGSVSFPVPVEGTTVRHREPLPDRSSITLKLECVSCR